MESTITALSIFLQNFSKNLQILRSGLIHMPMTIIEFEEYVLVAKELIRRAYNHPFSKKVIIPTILFVIKEMICKLIL